MVDQIKNKICVFVKYRRKCTKKYRNRVEVYEILRKNILYTYYLCTTFSIFSTYFFSLPCIGI